ncbi:lactoylglutathione lyase GLX1-like isoform X2 [Rhodamnia argentea]|uniref:Lactoylglutathione lyase GLX1-like isoform X2 n=1 Tax=Rhodamnia argentea TaxID=178133 RepID=A0A8B8Q6V8_9MYRT|nr:lactoylglutathione lyase GLX1-like isoform X2 [Rhodamnia argentea]
MEMAKHTQLFFPLLLLSVFLVGSSMAATEKVIRDNVLEWVKNDTHRFLNAVIRVGHLNRTVEFYKECFGMQLLSQKDFPEKKYSKAIVGFGPQESHFVLELIYIYGVEKYEVGTAWAHFGIAAQDIYPIVEKVRQLGGVVTREPGTTAGGPQVYAFVQDPNGYTFELLQQGPTPQPLNHFELQVTDLNRSVSFYEKALGMNLLLQYDSPQDQFAIAMVGYGSDRTQTVFIELRYNYNVTEYIAGNVYVHAAIGTSDVYKSAAAVALVTQELGGKIVRPPGPNPVTHTKTTSFLDPDGRKTVLVDNEDYLKEIKNGGQ